MNACEACVYGTGEHRFCEKAPAERLLVSDDPPLLKVGDLKRIMADLPDDMEVRYKYDSGYSYPGFVRASVRPTEKGGLVFLLNECFEYEDDGEQIGI